MFEAFDRWRRRRTSKRLLRKTPVPGLERLGSEYGGKSVPLPRLDKKSICYSFGVGEDLSFDKALMDKTGCRVFAFDPTPRAIEYVEKTTKDWSGFTFMPVALWTEDATLKFHPPTDATHVSHSLVIEPEKIGDPTIREIEVPCKRLNTLMKELGHEKIDVLKMDIEGAEYPVLEQAEKQRIVPTVICIEFHPDPKVSAHKLMDWRTIEAFERLKNQGYVVADVEGWNFTFVK